MSNQFSQFRDDSNVGHRPPSDTAPREGESSDLGENLTIPRESFEQTFLKCPVCQETFDKNLRAPKRLACNHNICFPCLIQLVEISKSTRVKCPECRQETRLPEDWCQTLPNNHLIMQMIELVSQVSTSNSHGHQAGIIPQSMCSLHDQGKLNFFCDTRNCKFPICRDCSVVQHKNHQIMEMKEAWVKYAPHFDDMQSRGRSLLDKMKTKSDSLANASTKMDLDTAQLESEIRQKFAKYREALSKREHELIKKLQSCTSERKSSINAKCSTMSNYTAQFHTLLDHFTSSRDSENIVEVFTMKVLLEEQELQLVPLVCDDAESAELLQPSKCRLRIQNEENFLSETRKLGEINEECDEDDPDQTWTELTPPASDFHFDTPLQNRAAHHRPRHLHLASRIRRAFEK